MRTLLVCYGIGIAGLCLAFFAMRVADDDCNRTRSAAMKADMLADPPRTKSLTGLVSALDAEHQLFCDGATLHNDTLTCEVLTACGLGSGAVAHIDLHVVRTARGVWTVVP